MTPSISSREPASGLPTSRVSMSASASRSPRTRSARSKSSRPRSAGVSAAHGPFMARPAAATARSTSSVVARATASIGSSVDGSMVGKLPPCCGATHAPSMNSRASVITRMSFSPWSSLEAAGRDALHEVALHGEEQEEARQAEQRRRGHGYGKAFELRVAPDHRREGGDADRQRLHVLVESDEQRPQEVVPVQGEDDDRCGNDRGPGERQRDAPEDQPITRAVGDRRLLELAREAEIELSEDVDAEDIGDGRQDQRLVGARPADLADGEEQGDDKY